MSPDRGRRQWWSLAGLPVLVALDVFLRRSLEHADTHLYSFFEYFYPTVEKAIFHGHYPWWKLLLPIRELTGAWSTTIIITHLIELHIGVANTWYLFNALLVVVSFATAWFAFESLAFAYTFAICMGFGTHFYHAYSISGGVGSPLIACWFEVLLLCAYRVVVAERRREWWAAAFAVSMVVTALSYEGWLDFVAFACAVAALLMIVCWRHHAWTSLRRLAAVATSFAVASLVYVVVKVNLGYGQIPGSESDVVFNYRAWAPALEDVASNIITHLYIAATNFLPPVFLSSTALFTLGGDRLVALQRGYHAPFSYLVPMHYLFFWRYAAGALAIVLGYVFVKLCVRAWRRPSPDAIAAIVFLTMMWLAGSTHAIIKIRPMKTAPVLGYHVLVGVMGVSLLIAYGIMVVWRDWPGARLRVAATALVWGVILYSALARPAMLNHLAAQVGLGTDQYPNPMGALRAMLGRPEVPSGGLEPYQLMRRPASFRDEPPAPPLLGDLAPLPTPAPGLATWVPGKGVKVTPSASSYFVEGNAAGGYQLVSPRIPVRPHHRIIVRAGGTMDHGLVCLGILKQRQEGWLFDPRAGLSELVADTGDNEAVWLVFTTCSPSGDAEPPQFQVTSISYATLMNADDAGR